MTDEKRRVLSMLAEGKITVDEAERLLAALDGKRDEAGSPPAPTQRKPLPRYLRVVVQDGATNVNVRVPLQLLRAGVKLSSLLPEEARGKVDAALGDRGFSIDLKGLREEAVDDLLRELADLTVDAEDGSEHVRIFCE
ncbi:MAG: hypothetical protein ACC662_00105 [Planctomycetota bacterium]